MVCRAVLYGLRESVHIKRIHTVQFLHSHARRLHERPVSGSVVMRRRKDTS